MQRKKILEQELLEPEQTDGWSITGEVKKIQDKMHFIGDIYRDGEYAARIAINKAEYAIYDAGAGRWTMQSPWYVRLNDMSEDIDFERMQCSRHTKERIAFFTKSKGNPGEALQDKMKGIWSKKEEEKRKKRREKEEDDFALTPEIPKDFEEWERTLFEDAGNIMFYRRDTRNKATIQCGVCGTTRQFQTSEYGEPLTISPPRAGERHICRNCGAAGIYKQAGRIKRDIRTRKAYLIQDTKDGGIIIRMFEVKREQEQGYKEYYSSTELIRAYLNRFKAKQYYWHTDYGSRKSGYWSRYNSGYWYRDMKFEYGEIYPGWRNSLQNSTYFRYCDLELYQDMANWGSLITTDIIQILKAYANMPQIEMMAKMGLRSLTGTAVRWEGVWSIFNKRAKNAAGFFRIEKFRLKGMGDISVEKLQVLQFEKRAGIRLDNQDIETLADHGTGMWEQEIAYITQFMSLKKALNRIRGYAEKEYHGNAGTARIEFYDYLKIRQELGYDMSNSVYLHPRSLRDSHQEMVAEKQRREDDEHIRKKMKEYPKIAERYPGLCKKYSYTDGEFSIRPAKSVEEIIMEGRLLHHCVGGDSYLSKHNRGTTSILFLRKETEPDTPYITMEIKETEIIQWYGIHDTKPEKEKMQQVIDAYVDYLRKKQKDREENRRIAGQVERRLISAAG